MTDPIRALAEQLRSFDRRLRACETAPRAQRTSVQNGSTRWLDPDGNEAVSIGVGDDGAFHVRVSNSDFTGSVFDVSSGRGAFPPGVASWVKNGALTVDTKGNPTHTGASDVVMLACLLGLTDADVNLGGFAASLSAGTCDWRVTAQALNDRDGHIGQTVDVTSVVGYSGSGDPFSPLVTIPPTVWAPDSNPVGTLVELRLRIANISGAGTADVYAVRGARCL